MTRYLDLLKKKPFAAIVACLLCLAVMVVALSFYGRPLFYRNYPWGKDTYRSFGNGRVQIMRPNYLFDNEKQKVLLTRVDSLISTKDIIVFQGVLDDKPVTVEYSPAKNKIESN